MKHLADVALEKASKLESGKVWLKLSATEKGVLLAVEERVAELERQIKALEVGAAALLARIRKFETGAEG